MELYYHKVQGLVVLVTNLDRDVRLEIRMVWYPYDLEVKEKDGLLSKMI